MNAGTCGRGIGEYFRESDFGGGVVQLDSPASTHRHSSRRDGRRGRIIVTLRMLSDGSAGLLDIIAVGTPGRLLDKQPALPRIVEPLGIQYRTGLVHQLFQRLKLPIDAGEADVR